MPYIYKIFKTFIEVSIAKPWEVKEGIGSVTGQWSYTWLPSTGLQYNHTETKWGSWRHRPTGEVHTGTSPGLQIYLFQKKKRKEISQNF